MSSSLGLGAQLRAFDRVFWICIFMELMERLAYYGVRLVVPVYMVLAPSEGGPGLSHTEKGTILAAWAAMQSWLPVFSGGFSDRFGYRRTIAVSVLLKTAGYAGMALADGYLGMLLGTQLLAMGTGLFKPGIQGTMAHSIAKNPGLGSMGWGLFYQSVNVGAAIGAYVPAFTRDVYGWHSVFWGCSAIVLSNLLPLTIYQDPVDERASAPDTRTVGEIVGQSIRDFASSPVLIGFTLISAGFWFTFHQIFDMLPNYVDDWTDSSVLLGELGRLTGNESWVAEAAAGVNIPQERLLNLNSLLIMTTMFVFAWASSKLRVLTSTILGMAIGTGAVLFYASSADVYVILMGITVFTVGEMLASPKRQEYMASLAPPGKRALYLGYANMPDGIGWVLGNLVAGSSYEERGDKVNLARRLLAEEADADTLALLTQKAAAFPEAARTELLEHLVATLKLPPDTTLDAALAMLARDPMGAQLVAEVLPRGEVLDFVVAAVPVLPSGTVTTLATLRTELYATYDPGQVWHVFVLVGGASVVLMVLYDRWVRKRLGTAT